MISCESTTSSIKPPHFLTTADALRSRGNVNIVSAIAPSSANEEDSLSDNDLQLYGPNPPVFDFDDDSQDDFLADEQPLSTNLSDPTLASMQPATTNRTPVSILQRPLHPSTVSTAHPSSLPPRDNPSRQLPCYAFANGQCFNNPCQYSHDQRVIAEYKRNKQRSSSASSAGTVVRHAPSSGNGMSVSTRTFPHSSRISAPTARPTRDDDEDP